MSNNPIIGRSLMVSAGIALCMISLRAAPNRVVRIIQSNSAGDNVDIIDPVTNKVVGEIKGIEVNHGVSVAPDGTKIYVTDEAESTLDVADGKTFEVVKRIKLSGHPNNLSVTPDGRRVYVAIVQAPGAVDVIDTQSLTLMKTIPTKGGEHNPYVTPDGRFVLASSIQGKSITVIDTETNQILWTVDMGNGSRPLALYTNPDGSMKWIFAQLTGVNGFTVVDFATHQIIKKVDNPPIAPWKKPVPAGADVSHGMAITPDRKTLLVDSLVNAALYAYSLPDLKLIGTADLGGKGAAWVTLTPDGKTAYIANAVTNNVSVVDVKSMKEIALIPVGFVPKRNTTGLLLE